MSKVENCYYVYTYTDPSSGEVFYVGKGKRYRDTEHLRSVINNDNREKGNMEKYLRIKTILNSGKYPEVSRIKENLSENEAYQLEADLIFKYGIAEDGGSLLNKYRSYYLTESDKISISNSLKKYYEENDVWNKGKKWSDKTKQKQSQSRNRFFKNGGLNSNTMIWVTPFGNFISRSKASKETGLTTKQLNKRCVSQNEMLITEQAANQINDFNAKEFIGYTWKQLGYGIHSPSSQRCVE